ncbi:MAG TPA: glutathione-regulated potassium-efflux system protein KefC [Burkholderiaceae bacterium]
MQHWLMLGLVYLAAAVVAVPVARFLGLGSIIGYLVAGIAIGPFGLQLVGDTQAILHFAELGVVLMLFLVGLELEPRRLWALRRPIFGWGSVQLFGSAALMTGVAVALGVDWRIALAASFALADSSTATGLGVAAERNLLPTTSGQNLLGVMLLQDVALIPILAFIPLLAASDLHASGGGWLGAAKVVGVIATIVLGGRLLLRPALRWIARSDTPEIFTAAALLLVVAAAALMHSAGLSMALGAFLAGMLLAESEYRRELETDIEPFKGLLLGLFFIAVGMSIDFAVVRAQPLLIAGIVIGMLVLKTVVLWAMARLIPIPRAERPVFILLLAQGGEVGFVVVQTATGAGTLESAHASLLVAAITVSMLVSPLLLAAADRWLLPRLARPAGAAMAEIDVPQSAPVIIAGFGRYGQIVGRLLFANGLSATVLEHDSDQVEATRRFGWQVYYGDATRLDLLRVAGAAQARVLVVAIDDVEQNLKLVDLAREHFPQLAIVARARNARHWTQLYQRGVQHIERETLDSALMSGRSVLELLGFEPYRARTLAQHFRRHSIEQLLQMAPHMGDEQRLISLAKAGREQLEQLLAQERALAVRTRGRSDEPAAGHTANADRPTST